MRSLLVAVAILVVTGCASAGERFYDSTSRAHAPFDSSNIPALRLELIRRAEGRRVVWVDENGERHQVEVTPEGLEVLRLPELAALWLATESKRLGGEYDTRIHLSSGFSMPVTVLSELDGSLEVLTGAPVVEGPSPTTAEIRARFGLRGQIMGEWGTVERASLFEALSYLGVDDLCAVQGADFVREEGERSEGRLQTTARFNSEGCRTRITLFSVGVQSNQFGFAGSPAAPRSATQHSLVHELGHAVEYEPARRRFCASEGRPVREANPLIAEGNRLARNGDILQAFMRALAGLPAPTDYGNTSPSEAFAESFALFHVDPDALIRTRPKVYRWFKDGGHIKAAR